MKKAIFSIFFSLLFGLSGIVTAQKDNISSEETLNYINGKFQGNYVLKNKRGVLVIEVYKDGKINRTDEVAIEDLNPENVYYAPDEKAIVVRCIANDCISRKTVVPKTKGQFSRINFAGEFDKKTQNGLLNAFEHLIRTFQDNKYKSLKPFEE